MKAVWNWVQAAIAAIGGFLGWFLGGLDGFLYALIAFVVIDYLTGVMCAITDKKLSSEIGAKGIFKKVLIFVLVGVGHIVDSQVLGNGGAIRTAVICQPRGGAFSSGRDVGGEKQHSLQPNTRVLLRRHRHRVGIRHRRCRWF
jgi:toxin secretion/phage lysis holin